MLNTLIKIIVRVITGLRKQNKLCVFTYHRVGTLSKVDAMPEELFEKQLIWIKRYFNPISLAEGVELQKRGCLPKRSVVITVDDGYEDIYNVIFPLLKKHELTATFFISTSGVNKGSLWDDIIISAVLGVDITTEKLSFVNNTYHISTYNQRLECIKSIISITKYKALEDREKLIQQLLIETGKTSAKHDFLSEQQIKLLHKEGMGIGAHTVNHPILTCESDLTAKEEMLQSKVILENIIGQQVDYLAYPNGKKGIDFTYTHEKFAKECGFKGAFSTDLGGINIVEEGLYSLKRLAPWDVNEVKFSLRLALNFI